MDELAISTCEETSFDKKLKSKLYEEKNKDGKNKKPPTEVEPIDKFIMGTIFRE
jgi:hypothetical protein